MTLVRHLLAKDFRRLRWLLLAWLAIVISRVVAATVRPELAFEGLAVQAAVENVSQLLMMIDLPVFVLLVSWLVHDEPLIGADAFWLTRPIPPMTLMTAKLTFATVLLIGAPALTQAVLVAVALRSPGHASRLIWTLLFSQVLWSAILIALATLTASLTRYLLTLVAGAAAAAFAISALLTLLLMTAEERGYPGEMMPDMMPDMTTVIVVSWLTVAVAGMVIALQYRLRRRRIAICVGAIGLIVSVVAAEAWPWRFGRPSEPDPGAWARDAVTVAAVLDRGEPYVTDEASIRRRSLKKQIAAPLRLAGVPPQYGIRSIGVRSALEIAGGPTLQSAEGSMVSVPRDPGDERASDYMAPVRAALLPSRLVGRLDRPQFAQWPIVLTVNADDYARYRRVPGRLTATIAAFLQESRLVASIPLDEGRMVRIGSTQVELKRVVRRPDGCSILIREIRESTGRPGIPRSYQYFLRNTERGEAVLGVSEQILSRGVPFATSFFVGWSVEGAGGSAFGFVDHIERYPAPFSEAGPIDADWLASADVAVVETVYAGRVSRSLVIEGFRMGR
jgi:hypothetical protein